MLSLTRSLTALLLLAPLTACLDGMAEGVDGTATTTRELASCPTPPSGSGALCDLGDGRRRFAVTLPSGQAYVEVFVRQNGLQNVAQAIQGRGTAHADGTTTYTLTRDGYGAGDLIEYRFYSYLPASPGVFTPGPIEQRWYRNDPVEHVTDAPVTADAAVIYASLGVGPAADKNFGAAPSVDIGEYHLTSDGLFAYALASVPAGATVTRAELIIPAPIEPGGPTVTLRLDRIVSAWSESTVTWNTRPAYQLLREVSVAAGVENRLDVTAAVADAIAAGAPDLGLALQPSPGGGVDNIFIDSKERAGGHPTSLSIRWTE